MSGETGPSAAVDPLPRNAVGPRIDWSARPPRSVTCPACGSDRPKAFVLSSAASWNSAQALDLLLCPDCDCKFFPDLKQPEYEELQGDEAYLKFYLETGAGVDQLVRHLFAVPRRDGGRYLEVGCGFGFGLDFARQALGQTVLGIDPSPAAAAGARLLRLPIIEGYLTPDTPLPGGAFDLVVASEVIEHIFEPEPFVRLVAGRLKSDGVLILTTPDAAGAARETADGALLPLLSTGWHYILYSREALHDLLRRSGFARVEIAVRGYSLVAAATNGDAAIDIDALPDHKLFVDYLDARRKTVEQGTPLAHGLGYRLLQQLVNGGEYQRAAALGAELREELRSAYGFDLEAPHQEWLRARPGESFSAFAMRYPMCLCGIAYFCGILSVLREAHERAAGFFALAARYGDMLRGRLQEIGADDAATDSMAARSRGQYLREAAYARPDEAARGALELLQNIKTRTGAYPFERPDLIGVFAHLAALGSLAEADKLAGEAEEYLRERGEAATADRRALRAQLHRGLGSLELNHRRRPRRAAAHFACEERVLRLGRATEPGPAYSEPLWQARHDRLLAWMVAGDARRALLVAQGLRGPLARHQVPPAIAESAAKLIAKISRTTWWRPFGLRRR